MYVVHRFPTSCASDAMLGRVVGRLVGAGGWLVGVGVGDLLRQGRSGNGDGDGRRAKNQGTGSKSKSKSKSKKLEVARSR